MSTAAIRDGYTYQVVAKHKRFITPPLCLLIKPTAQLGSFLRAFDLDKQEFVSLVGPEYTFEPYTDTPAQTAIQRIAAENQRMREPVEALIKFIQDALDKRACFIELAAAFNAHKPDHGRQAAENMFRVADVPTPDNVALD